VLLVNLLAALNFANFFKNKKKYLENKKTSSNVKNLTKVKKRKKRCFTSMHRTDSVSVMGHELTAAVTSLDQRHL